MRVLQDVRPLGTTRRSIPTASKAGLGVIAIGMFADLLAHIDVGFAEAGAAMTSAQLSAHLVTFLGMVLVLIGVVVDGMRPDCRATVRATQGRHRHAVR